MHPAASQRGFALITAILLLVVILALGYGSLYMSETSLHVNENARSKAIARSNAEAGLDAAILFIGHAAAAGALPSAQSLTSNPVRVVAPSGTTTVTVSSYDIDPNDANRIRIAVTGTGPRDARHTAEALIGEAPGAQSQVDPLFYRGLVAKGVVGNSGGIAPIIAAEIHGDGGYKLEADFQTCLLRDSTTGLCTSTSPITEGFPLTAATQPVGFKYECGVKSTTGLVDPCTGGRPMNLVAPVELTAPDYTAIRNAALFDGRPIGDYLADPTLCTHTTVPLAPPPNSVICATGEVDLSSRVFGNNVLIITPGRIKSGGGSNLNGVTLVSTGHEITMSGGNIFNDVRFFAEDDLTLSGGNTGGSSTIASGGSVTMSGGTEALAPSVDGGKTTVGLAIIAGGDVTLSGGSVYYGTIWSGTTTSNKVTLSGGTNIFGGIATMGNITLTGGAFVDSNVNVVNGELPKIAGSGFQLLSQR